MTDPRGVKRQISPHPRYKPRRRTNGPAIAAAGGAVLVVVVAAVLLLVTHPWSGGGATSVASGPSASHPAAVTSATATNASPAVTLPDTTASAGPNVTPPPTPNSGPTYKVYVVRAGDTWSRIAKKNEVSDSALRAANPNITNTDKIYIGEKINIPVQPAASPSLSPPAGS